MSDSLYSLVTVAELVSDSDDDSMKVDVIESWTELDSHANMPVVGRHVYILSKTGKTVDVSAFSPDLPTLQIPVMDAALKYTCSITGKVYILVIWNALHVPTMKHNFIPPFFMREKGITVRNVPKIHMKDPSISDHAIEFEGFDFHIPLRL